MAKEPLTQRPAGPAPSQRHTCDFCFTVLSNCVYATDVTPAMLRLGILTRLAGLSDHELSEACGYVDTTEVD